MGDTRDSGFVSTADDVLEMSVVRGVRRSGLVFTNPVGTGGVLDVCLCLGCGAVGGEWRVGMELGTASGRVSCESGFFV